MFVPSTFETNMFVRCASQPLGLFVRVTGDIGEDVMGMYPLRDDEQLLWSGEPQRPKRWFLEHAVMLSGIAAAAAFVVLLAIFDPSFPIFALFVPMFVVMATATPGQLRSLHLRAQATKYLVTDLRIIFVMQWPAGAEFRWVWHHRLPRARVKADKRGVGTITFGTSRWTRWTLANKPQSGAWAPFVPDLHAVADAPRVAELIRQAQRTPLPR
jgi:hypothetical protein